MVRSLQARRPGQPLIGPLLRHQIAQEQAEIPTLHLLRGQTRGHAMLEVLRHPPRQAIGLART